MFAENGMSPVLRCTNKHEWHLKPGDPLGHTTQVCPICGEPELTRVGPMQATLPATVSVVHSLPSAAPVLSGYDIFELLDEGGMGRVYRARQRATGRIVALKVIRHDRVNHPEVVARFQREARAARALAHPNIVEVIDDGVEQNTPYLVMELVVGKTLQQLVHERGGPLPVAEACEILRQAALGLQHLHEKGLVHRDIKPSNLMVTTATTPSGRLVKILDMGVVRLRQLAESPEEWLSTLTQQGTLIGTLDYIAPEQVENSHSADIRADLYSLGCTAYFLLCGHEPFRNKSIAEKIFCQRYSDPVPIDQVQHEVPSVVAAVVRRLMTKNPQERYQTPAELVEALDELAATGQIALFRAASLPLRQRFQAHCGAVYALSFLDAQHLLSGGHDQTLRLWDLATQTERLCVEQSRPVVSVATFPNAALALIATGVTLRLLEMPSGKELQRWAGHTDAVRSVAFEPTGRLAVSGGDDRLVRIWEVQSGRTLDRLRQHRAGITSVAFAPSGLWIASAGREPALWLWDTQTGKTLRPFDVPRGMVLATTFRGQHPQLASTHYDTSVRLWECETGRERRRFQGHRQMVTALACSPDGRLLASAGHDRMVKIWDPETGVERSSGIEHTGPVECLAFSPDGTLLASGGADGTICLWEVPG